MVESCPSDHRRHSSGAGVTIRDPAPIPDAVSTVTDISTPGLGKIGVQEVLTDTATGKVLAKSAIRVVTVKA